MSGAVGIVVFAKRCLVREQRLGGGCVGYIFSVSCYMKSKLEIHMSSVIFIANSGHLRFGNCFI